MNNESNMHFRLDHRRGIAPYRQLVDQVREAVIAGRLEPGDRLPPVREVVTQVTINPNTVHRAYRELEHLGFTESRWGCGTFIASSPKIEDSSMSQLSEKDTLTACIARAMLNGMSEDEILDTVMRALSRKLEVET
jgi:GntR family transcriptional regulator